MRSTAPRGRCSAPRPVVYQADGQLMGHVVAVDGQQRRGSYETVRVQSISLATLFVERHCAPVERWTGDLGY